jgi:Zn-dependent peptidase ImmA (M78 family)
MKPLLKAAAQLGYSVRFVDDWGIWRDLNIPLKSTAIGACVFSKKKIIVSLKSREGRKFSIPDLAFIVAHEIRHALHKADGVFEGEYEVAFSDQAAKGAIEDDCDAFAMSYLEAKGVLKGGLAAQARKNGLKPVYLHLFKQ